MNVALACFTSARAIDCLDRMQCRHCMTCGGGVSVGRRACGVPWPLFVHVSHTTILQLHGLVLLLLLLRLCSQPPMPPWRRTMLACGLLGTAMMHATSSSAATCHATGLSQSSQCWQVRPEQHLLVGCSSEWSSACDPVAQVNRWSKEFTLCQQWPADLEVGRQHTIYRLHMGVRLMKRVPHSWYLPAGLRLVSLPAYSTDVSMPACVTVVQATEAGLVQGSPALARAQKQQQQQVHR